MRTVDMHDRGSRKLLADIAAAPDNPTTPLACPTETALRQFQSARLRWRSQDPRDTIDSIDYMDMLDEIDLDAALNSHAALTAEVARLRDLLGYFDSCSPDHLADADEGEYVTITVTVSALRQARRALAGGEA